MNSRNLLVVLATLSGLFLAVGSRTASGVQSPAVGSEPTEPRWYIIEDRPSAPDLLLVGLGGEPYVDPLLPPAIRDAERRRAEREVPSDFLPRLELRCENGVTSLTIYRPLRTLAPRAAPGSPFPRPSGGTGGGLGPRGGDRASADPFAGKLILMLAEENRIEIDLADYPVRTDPILVPEPYDRIGDLRRHEAGYFFEVQNREGVWMGFGSQAWGAEVDAVFPLVGLDDVLRATRDPCGWRAS